MSEHAAISALREHQQQLDPDGIMVGVSRQALEETLCYVEELEQRIDELEAFIGKQSREWAEQRREIHRLQADNAELRAR